MKKAVLVAIVILAFGLRLYRINNPIADWHSWRQADTAAVSRNFVQQGFDLLHPHFDDLSNVASGKENPNGYRFVEFPIYNLFHALLFKFLPIFSLEVWGRLLSIVFSLGSLVFLYLIAESFLGINLALLAAFFFAILPFNIYYSRVILPEPMMVFSGLGMIWFYIKYIEHRAKGTDWRNVFLPLFLATIFAAISWLLKPFSLVLLLPVAYLAWESWRLDFRKYLVLSSGILLSLIPFIFWRWWIGHYPEGIPYSAVLFNLSGIRLKGAFFWWLFAERIGKLILGAWGLIFLGIGFVAQPNKKEKYFFYFWLAAIFVYFVIVAQGNVQHDYYQVISIPIICIFLAKGSYFLLAAPSRYFNKIFCVLLFIFSLLFMFAFSWYQVRDYFNINNPAIIAAGKEVERLVPANAKVIAPYGGDTAFLYQTTRQGWPVGIEIEKMIKLGATYYVNVNFGPETDWLMGTYCPIEKTSQYVVIDLTRKCSL